MFEIRIGDLLLRPIKAGDARRFVELCNDELIACNTARVPHPYTDEAAAAFVTYAMDAMAAGKEFPFAVCCGGEIVACAGAEKIAKDVCEIGYWVGAEYRRQGVALAAARAVTQFAFAELGAEKLTAGHFIDNPASGKVLARAGFKSTGETGELFSVGRGETAPIARLEVLRADFELRPDIVITRRES